MYDFWVSKSCNAVKKPNLNLSTIASIGILSRHIRLTLLEVDPVTKLDNWFLASKMGVWWSV